MRAPPSLLSPIPPSHPCPSLHAPEPRNRPRALRSRWLSQGNPDPDGFHLKIVAAVARVYMHEEDRKSPLTKAFAAKGLGAPDFALFCALPTPLFPSPRIGGRVRASMCAYLDSSPPCAGDFASLFQQPREEPKQVELFNAGLRASNVWYGHESTVCWM